MATISSRPTNGFCSATTSPRSRGRGRWSARHSRLNSDICRALLWILFGAVLGGAVQDFVILFCPCGATGNRSGQMAREEIGKSGGFVALVTVLLIMIILLAVVALVVVNALKGSPWGTFTIAATMPIAVLMGLYLRYVRPGKVLECSVIGFVLVGGGFWRRSGSPHSSHLAPWFTWAASRSRSRSSSMVFWQARCRFGCCLLRATISARL